MFPIFITKSAPTCPSCGKEENIVCTCANCNHIYTDDDESGCLVYLFIGLAVCFSAILVALFLQWATDATSDVLPYEGSFIDYLGEIWDKILMVIRRIF